MDPSVEGSPLEVLIGTESIDLQFGKLEVFEGQPKFHLVFQPLPLSLPPHPHIPSLPLSPENIYLVPRELKIHFYIQDIIVLKLADKSQPALLRY